MVSALVSGSNGPGSSPGGGHWLDIGVLVRHLTLTVLFFTECMNGYRRM